MKFIFDTKTTMKEYNQQKYWVDNNIVPTCHIEAKDLNDALLKYKEYTYEHSYVEISDNALKNKNAMYIDKENEAEQVGYVITGKTIFSDEKNNRWVNQYIELWVRILIASTPVFVN